MTKRLCVIALGGVLALLVLVSPAHASTIAPGGCAGLGTASCPGTLTDFGTVGLFGQAILADSGAVALATASFTGFVREIVLTDGVTGGKDFLYQVQRTGPAGGGSTIGELSAISFAGWTTDVGYCSACSSGGELIVPLNANPHIAPGFATRGASGSEILFDFGAGIGDSDQSFVLLIKTNAPSFFTGSIFVRDGNTAVASGFGATAVPEPTTLVLTGCGLLYAARRRRQRAQA